MNGSVYSLAYFGFMGPSFVKYQDVNVLVY